MANSLKMEARSSSEILVNTQQVADSLETLVNTLKLDADIYFALR
jgi:hypothetical protein